MVSERELQSSEGDSSLCPNCGGHLEEHLTLYLWAVCVSCDSRALDSEGRPAEDGFRNLKAPPDQPTVETSEDGTVTLYVPASLGYFVEEDGPNPVFVDGRKCWRRYRFGGWATMLDPYGCGSLAEFYARQNGDELIPCPICGEYILGIDGDYGREDALDYPGLVCHSCDERAVNSDGQPAIVPQGASGDNPVFIHSRKCWRLYASEFGNDEWQIFRHEHVTILASDDSGSSDELRRIRGHHRREMARLLGIY